MRRFSQPIQSNEIANAAVTGAKFDPTLADQLGITSESTTRRLAISAATERTSNNNANSVDVTGASGTITIPNTTGYTLATFKCDLKFHSGDNFASQVGAGIVIGNYSSGTSLVTTQESFYVTLTQIVTIHNNAIGSGAKTAKVVFRGGYTVFDCCGSVTTYYATSRIQNVSFNVYTFS